MYFVPPYSTAVVYSPSHRRGSTLAQVMACCMKAPNHYMNWCWFFADEVLWDSHILHDDVIKWKHFPRYWPFVRGIHRSPVNSPHKGQWRGTLMFSLICVWINGWVNNRETGDLRRHRAHYDVIVMEFENCTFKITATHPRGQWVTSSKLTVQRSSIVPLTNSFISIVTTVRPLRRDDKAFVVIIDLQVVVDIFWENIKQHFYHI